MLPRALLSATKCRYFVNRSVGSVSARGVHVYIVAGEPSGDVIGGQLMKRLKERVSPSTTVTFSGVGGETMLAEGLSNELFPMEDLAVMGISEVLFKLPKLLGHANRVAADIVAKSPDVVVTIDSKGFNFRMLQTLKKRAGPGAAPGGRTAPPVVHYVSPSFWAYKRNNKSPGDLKHFIDEILCILPFEEKHYRADAEGVRATYVGHPAVESMLQLTRSLGPTGEVDQDPIDTVRARLSILRAGARSSYTKPVREQDGCTDRPQAVPKAFENIVLFFPGSRIQEVNRALPIMFESLGELVERGRRNGDGTPYTVIVQTLSRRSRVGKAVTRYVREQEGKLRESNIRVRIETSARGKTAAFAAADAALATSGTVVTELAIGNVPTVVIYPTDALTGIVAKHLAKVSYVSIPNIIANKGIIPEILFEECEDIGLVATNLGEALSAGKGVVGNGKGEEKQRAMDTALRQLVVSGIDRLEESHTYSLSSEIAADVVLRQALGTVDRTLCQ